MSADPRPIDRRDATRVFGRIGLLSFGGPAAQIAVMHRLLVAERGWLSEREFLNALSFCMLLPGPEAMQLATFAGWRLHGIRGGLVAGLLFVAPGAAVMMVLSALYVAFGQVAFVDTLFLGVQAAAVVVVVQALLRLAGRALPGRSARVLSVLAFVAIFLFAVPFPVIVLTAAAYGAATAAGGEGWPTGAVPVSPRRTIAVLAIGVAIWATPLAALAALGGPQIAVQIGLFFSKLAVVTFGGAYAVLAYMAQDVVARLGWLDATQMMDGLGLAETTPGPLILVTQFVGFLAGFRETGWGGALLGAGVTLWVTFVPCFVWIFAGAPYVDAIASRPRLNAALAAITAAVVGVIANLSLWFALHVVFADVTPRVVGAMTVWLPDPASVRPEAMLLIGLSGYLLLVRGLGFGVTLIASATAALALGAAFGV